MLAIRGPSITRRFSGLASCCAWRRSLSTFGPATSHGGPRPKDERMMPAALPTFKTKACGVLGSNAADVPAGSPVQRHTMDSDHRTSVIFPGIVDHADDRAVESVRGDLLGELLLFLLTGLAMQRRLGRRDGEAAHENGCRYGHQAKGGIQPGHLINPGGGDRGRITTENNRDKLD